jgi:hypothetical protein
MTKKSTLIFCEGPHDVALVSLIFKTMFNATEFRDNFSQLPFPFSNIFQTALQKHAKLELSLDMAHKFFLPDKILTKDNNYIIIFNSGGKNRGDKIKPLIQNLWELTSTGDVFTSDSDNLIKDHKYLFIYDADHNDQDFTLNEISREFNLIDNTPWITQSWDKKHGTKIAINSDIDHVAALVWCDRESGFGTLEDILTECLHTDENFIEAQEKIKEMYHWDTENISPKRRVAEKAKMLKASISLLGQREKPGGSMNVIVSQTKLLNQEKLTTSPTISDVIEFFSDFCFA